MTKGPKGELRPAHYPLIFRYKDCIAGNGFLASVVVSGRALMTKEDGKWWMYGVRPSAIAETGQTPQETALRFRERYRRLLYDFVGKADGISDFTEEVQVFFNEKEPAIEKQWSESFKLIREGRVKPEAPFSKLPKERPEENEPTVSIEEIEPSSLSPEDNIPKGFAEPELLAA